MMITSLFKFVWNAIVWLLPIFLSGVIFFAGGESNKGLSTLFAVVYLTAAFCMSFVIKGEFTFVLSAIGLAFVFFVVLAQMTGK
ncbi:MAG: hypothetical protein IJR63_01210 [Synergistaceae bacterium]|nr:hypothetical protein [Synergistaceae bacterium]